MVVNIQEMTAKAPVLMGVVNVTPDSFSDGGLFFKSKKAINHAVCLLEEGADILDIGGESTRPGAKVVTSLEEQKRILPVIKAIKKESPNTVISVDTRNADTMQIAIDYGADIINDVSALSHDPQSIKVIAQAQCPVILMHMQGTPQTMQDNPDYLELISDVHQYLDNRVDHCVDNGIKKDNIIIDVGFGFGKTLDHNLALFKNLYKYHAIGCPLLVGASRKSFIEKICPNTPADQRLSGSLASAIMAFENGVQFFRVHDVKETRQALEVWKAMK